MLVREEIFTFYCIYVFLQVVTAVG